jgi:hypothetical protein
VLNVARTEFDEDENEENKTEDFFVQLQHLQVFFHSFQRNNQLFIPESCYNKYTHHISIIKANHCFRI